MNTNQGQQWLSSQGVADRYGVPLGTVRKWRHEGTGPAGVKFGRHVRYSIEAVEQWEREHVARQPA